MIDNAAPKLLITSREAARLLAISERTLWGLTKRQEIPCVRICRAVRYDPRDLERWIAQKKEGTERPQVNTCNQQK